MKRMMMGDSKAHGVAVLMVVGKKRIASDAGDTLC